MHKADDFQKRALRTWHKRLNPLLQRDHAVLGLVSEAGEYANLYKKDVFKPGAKSSRRDRLLELGDVFYYLCILANLDGCTIEELSAMNAEKLKDFHGWQPDYYAR